MRLPFAAFLLAATALAGCSEDGPDALLPGVMTTSEVEDELRCGELLFAAGCVLVRIPRVDSGCAPEVPGYMLCETVVEWTAESGAVLPQTQLSATVNGTDAGSCTVAPGARCSLAGNATFRHHFTGPGQRHFWNVSIVARAVAPGDPAPMTGEFTLTVRMLVRTQDASEAEA